MIINFLEIMSIAKIVANKGTLSLCATIVE